MTKLQIAPGVSLPPDVVTQKIAVLGRTGSGKTYTAKVLVEELVRAKLPVVAIDPMGAFWGLRASADGKDEGLPVTIFGGEHGDLPLPPSAGAISADIVVEHPGAYVLDLSQFESDAEEDRFAEAFATRLYRNKAKDRRPVLLVVDEADRFAPQRPFKGQERMLGAFTTLMRRARIRGLGMAVITQRPASLNKNVLTQAELMIVHQLTGPQDRDAVDDWVKLHGTKEERETFLASLAKLKRGEAWLWSPSWLGVYDRVQIRRAKTYDSSKTPEPGQELVEPARLKPVQLKALETRMAETIERAKADDPKELQRQIRDLRSENERLAHALETTPKDVQTEVITERVEVQVMTKADRQRIAHVHRAIDKATETVPAIIAELTAAVASLEDMAGRLQQTSGSVGKRAERALPAAAARGAATSSTPAAADRGLPTRSSRPPRAAAAAGEPVRSDVGDVQIKAGARRMLEVLASFHPMRLTKPQMATLAKMKVTGGTFGTYFSVLRREQLLLEDGDELSITDRGFAVLGTEPPLPPSSDEVVEMYRSKLKAGARRMLDVIVAAYPESIERDDLAAAIEMEPTGGTFGTYLSTLRRNGLAEVDGSQVRAGAVLFLGDA